MTEAPSPRQRLRDETRPWHDRVDALFGAADLRDRNGYAAFLQAQAAAHVPAEAALEARGIGTLVPDWDSRKRAGLILADLSAMGVDPAPPLAVALLPGEAALLGALYVLEGSRLGGAVLRRSVPAELPSAFLSAGAPGAWRRLIALLDARLRTAKEIDEAVYAACHIFALFEESGRRMLNRDPIAC